MDASLFENLKNVLLKPSRTRTYDDILLIKSFLSKTDFFKKHVGDAVPKLLDELYRCSYLEKFECGEVVFRQGDIGDKLYIVIHGQVEIKAKVEVEVGNKIEYRDKIFTVVTHGQYFGERALVNTEPRSASATCVHTNCEMISITKEAYLGAMSSVNKLGNTDELDDYVSKTQYGSKEHIIRILSKGHHRRSPEEILLAVGYLESRIPFFQKFDPQQRQELCRVLDVISFKGRNVVFRQGTIGQGFYIILTGTVEVYTKSSSEKGISTLRSVATTPKKTVVDTMDGLGDKVSQMKSGEVFGERALENDSCLRMASAVTGEELTQLIVIAKEDFLNLVSFIMHSDIMEKIAVLRKTSLFQTVEGIHLRALAKCMYPRVIHIGKKLYEAGKNLDVMTIIARGELRAEIEVEPTLPAGYVLTKSASRLNLKGRQCVDLGRIAPSSVLGKNILLCESVHDEKISTETVIATTLVEYYSISKIDFLSQLLPDSKQVLARLVKNYEAPLIPQLWDNGTTILRDNDWKKKRAWDKFKEDLVMKDKISSDIVKNYRSMGQVHLKTIVPDRVFQEAYHQNKSGPERMIGQYKSSDSKGLKLFSPSSTPKAETSIGTVGLDWGTPAAITREKEERITKAFQNSTLKPKSMNINKNYSFEDDKEVLKAIEKGNQRDSDRRSQFISSNGLYDDISGNNMDNMLSNYFKPTTVSTHLPNHSIYHSPQSRIQSNEYNGHKGGSHSRNHQDSNTSGNNNLQMASDEQLRQQSLPPSSKSTVQQFPFTLIQFHRETIGGRGATVGSTIRRAARTHARLCGAVGSCHHAKELAELIMKNAHLCLFSNNLNNEEELKLNWRAFHGFESLPMQNSDHFLIYCKNTPVEYACLSPSKQLISHDFPSACKSFGQRFACVLTRPISGLGYIQPSPSRQSTAKSFSTQDSSHLSELQYDTTTKGNILTKPIIVSEISAIIEMIAVAFTQYDCLKYALVDDIQEFSDKEISIQPIHSNLDSFQYSEVLLRGKKLLKQRLQQQPELSINVFPLYEWIVIDKQCLEMNKAKKTLEVTEDTKIDVKLSKENYYTVDEKGHKELQGSLKESGLLGVHEKPIDSNKIFQLYDKPSTYTSSTKSLKMLERELKKKGLSYNISKQNYGHNFNLEQTKQQQSTNDLNSIGSNGSMKTYYRVLLEPRKDDDLQGTRKRLEALKVLAESRSKILSLNETICNTENTLVAALECCKIDGIPITAVKFKKLTSQLNDKSIKNSVDSNKSNNYSDNDNSSNTIIISPKVTKPSDYLYGSNRTTSSNQLDGSRGYTDLKREEYQEETIITTPRDIHTLHTAVTTPKRTPVFTVTENILRTIEHSVKGKDSKVRALEQEIGLGLGLIKKRNEIYESLLHVPSLSSITKQREIIEMEEAMKEDAMTHPKLPKVPTHESKLGDKFYVLENMLHNDNNVK